MAKRRIRIRHAFVGHFGGHNPTEEECRNPALGRFARKQRQKREVVETFTWTHQEIDDFELDLAADPIQFEQYSNGETLLPSRIGLWRDAAITRKDFLWRRMIGGSRGGYETWFRKDRVRVEPIRQARRNSEKSRWN